MVKVSISQISTNHNSLFSFEVLDFTPRPTNQNLVFLFRPMKSEYDNPTNGNLVFSWKVLNFTPHSTNSKSVSYCLGVNKRETRMTTSTEAKLKTFWNHLRFKMLWVSLWHLSNYREAESLKKSTNLFMCKNKSRHSTTIMPATCRSLPSFVVAMVRLFWLSLAAG